MHFNRIFPYKPTILVYPHFRKPPADADPSHPAVPVGCGWANTSHDEADQDETQFGAPGIPKRSFMVTYNDPW